MYMPRNYSTLVGFSWILMIVMLFSACSTAKVGTIPQGTPDIGSGTPAVIPTPGPPAARPADAQAFGAFYAFVRKKQLWVALNRAHPVQVTNFDYSRDPNVFWHRPLWSPGDRHIAFIMDAQPVGLGGGGCPGPDSGAHGGLYVMNTATKQFSLVTLPKVIDNTSVKGRPYDDFWQYISWEDAKHLLAWYNGPTGKVSDAAGLYRYNVETKQLKQVIPLKALGVATLANPQQDMPLLLSMRYSSGQLFYQVVVHPFRGKSQLVIYRHAIAQPAEQSKKILQMGEEPWCATPQSGPYIRPGWDISPDGEQLAAQMILMGKSDQGVGAIQVRNLADNSMTALFTQAPAELLAHDLTLTWGPDSQTVVATEYHTLTQRGPYTASLTNPTATQQYAPNLAGQVVWRSDSSAFALQSTEPVDETGTSNIYVFQAGDKQGRTLLTDAHDFAWG
jgi:hypothetical protein